MSRPTGGPPNWGASCAPGEGYAFPSNFMFKDFFAEKKKIHAEFI